MKFLATLIIALNLLSVFASIMSIGQERKPITPGSAILGLIFSSIYIFLLYNAYL